ncbi:hypothetical protein [Haloferula sargassicola]|uniref:Uncharacterized protein n=1 Tax=Haloferula sargassicola TaxID=490096 RepID=A0ABP9UKF6_9BACT
MTMILSNLLLRLFRRLRRNTDHRNTESPALPAYLRRHAEAQDRGDFNR